MMLKSSLLALLSLDVVLGAYIQLEERAALAPLPTGAVGFKVVSPEQALSQLSSVAQATPSLVSIVPGVPLSIDKLGKVHDIVPTGVPLISRDNDEELEDTLPSPAKREPAAAAAAAACTKPTVVYEWRNMKPADQAGFSAAIRCLIKTPSRSGLAGAKTRWDDLAAIHSQMTPTIHWDGQFLLWHRYFLWIFEQELRKTCGYKGAMAWWDETKDAGKFASAPMFNSAFFGDMPDGKKQCIRDGVSVYSFCVFQSRI